MGRKCVVPKCRSGLLTNPEKVSMFSIPKNRLEIWQRALPSKKRQLTHKDCVCAKHFRESDIIREIKTDTFTYPLQLPKLQPDAVPCIFPIVSNYQLRPRTEEKRIIHHTKNAAKIASTTSSKGAVTKASNRSKQAMTQEQLFKMKLEQLRRTHKDNRNLTREKYKKIIHALTAKPLRRNAFRNYNVVNINGVNKLMTPDSLYYVHDDDLFKILSSTHVDLGHASTHIMMSHLKRLYKNILRRDVVAFRRTCPSCKRPPVSRSKTTKRKKVDGEEILYSDLSRRCSVNILNYQGRPSGDYAHVMIYQNVKTKFCLLRALQTDTPAEVAQCLADIFCMMGVSEEIESNIGRQFWEAVAAELIHLWPEFTLTFATRAEPEIMATIKSAINETVGNSWSECLNTIQLEQNREFDSGVEAAPYDVIFGLSEESLPENTQESHPGSFVNVSEDVVGAVIKMEECKDPLAEEGQLNFNLCDCTTEDCAEDPLAEDVGTFDSSEPVEEDTVRVENKITPGKEDGTNGVCVGCGAVSINSDECTICFKKKFVKPLLPISYTLWDDNKNLQESFETKLQLNRQMYQSSGTMTKAQHDDFVTAVEEGKNYQIVLDYQLVEREGVKRLVKTEMKDRTVKHYVHDEELFFILHYTHINLRHAWRNRMITELNKRFANILTQDIMTYLNLCPTCSHANRKFHREPVIYSDVSAHCSINFIHYHLRPDGGYKYVLVYQNKLTKFYMLKALCSLRPAEVAHNLIDIFTFIGVPTLIESNEDWNFIEDVIRQLKFVWENVDVQHLKSEKYDVEIVDEDLRNWMAENKTVRWTKGLRFVQLAMNQEYNELIETAPYDALFELTMGPEGWDDDSPAETDDGILSVLKELYPSLHKSYSNTTDKVLEAAFVKKLGESRQSVSSNQHLSKEKYYELMYQVTSSKGPVETDTLRNYGVTFFKGANRLTLPSTQESGKVGLYAHDDDLFTILHYVHRGLQHARTIKMNDYLKIYFVNICSNDIFTYCKLCPICIKKSRRIRKKKTEYIASSSMSSKCSVDIINFEFYPDDEFQYIMVYENTLTKFCMLKPMKTKSPDEVADNLMDVLSVMGACEVIQSNEGVAFVKKVIKVIHGFWSDFGVKYGGCSTCALHDIDDEVKRWIMEHRSLRWSKMLPSIQLAWNSSIQMNMVNTPYEETFKLI